VEQVHIEEFTEQLRRSGFDQIVLVEREPLGRLDSHSHPFQSRALVVEGEITLIVDGQEMLYRAGDIFQLERGQLHIERYGGDGVRYLVGRK
jgi:quercetin dioxygenase-like cupin family protein